LKNYLQNLDLKHEPENSGNNIDGNKVTNAMLRNLELFQNKIKSFVTVTAAGAGVFAGISIYKGNEEFYKDFLMPFSRLLPPEVSHNLAVLACKYKIFPVQKDNDPQSLVSIGTNWIIF
jgi:hypothetical protein